MEVLFILLPLSLVLVGLIVWAVLWAARSGQFDDLEGPAHRILMDEDENEGRQDAERSAGERPSGVE